VTEDEYYAWFAAAGYQPTGYGTELTEEFENEHGTKIMVTRARELSSKDRAAAIERYKRYLGINYPPHGSGVH